jgi:hypothetical protein
LRRWHARSEKAGIGCTRFAAADGEEGDSWTIQVQSVEVGKDGNRNPKYGGYITIVEPPGRHADAVAGKDTKKKLPASAKIALDALADALVEVGQKPPASTLIPHSGACAVHIDQCGSSPTVPHQQG